MTIDPEAIQTAVDQAKEEYEEKTLLVTDLVQVPDQRTSVEECSESLTMPVESVERTLHSINITSAVDSVLGCEYQTFLNGLETKSDRSEKIDEDVVAGLLKTIGGVSVPKHLYLPNKPKLRKVMEDHQADEIIGIQRDVPVHWFNPDVLNRNKGFLLDDGIYVNQYSQGQTPVISKDLDAELSEDNSENRLRMFLRRVRGGNYELDFQTRFSLPKKIDDRSLILSLELPDISYI